MAMNCKKRKRNRKTSWLIAALITLLMIGTVSAVAISYMTAKDVSEETVGMHRLESGNVVFHEWEDASVGFDFVIEGDWKDVSFKPGWLPSPISDFALEEQDEEGYMTYAVSDANAEGQWEIALYSASRLKDKTFFISGDAEILAEDEWNGWQRTVVRVDEGSQYKSTNYLLLFSAQDNYLLCISSTLEQEVLERMAGDLEIRVLNGTTETPPADKPAAYESQPLDMEGNKELDADSVYEEAPKFSFEVTEPCYKTLFRANWLPDESYTSYTDDEGYTELLIGHQTADGIPYSINIYQGDWLYNKTVWFWQMNTETTIVEEDTCNGMQRIELVMENTTVSLKPQNHILMFSPEGNCLIYIYGVMDMETLESISEGIEIKVTDTELLLPDCAPRKEQLVAGGIAKG